MDTYVPEYEIKYTCNLGPFEKIPLGEGREFDVAGELIAVFRDRRGKLYAVQAQCPHRAGSLADGIIGGGEVICPMHSYKFDLESGRMQGHAAKEACPTLKRYYVRLNSRGDVLVSV